MFLLLLEVRENAMFITYVNLVKKFTMLAWFLLRLLFLSLKSNCLSCILSCVTIMLSWIFWSDFINNLFQSWFCELKILSFHPYASYLMRNYWSLLASYNIDWCWGYWNKTWVVQWDNVLYQSPRLHRWGLEWCGGLWWVDMLSWKWFNGLGLFVQPCFISVVCINLVCCII
jgi:hypothetical protein